MYENDCFDDEITMEDAYDAGYAQALADMGYEYDDAEEDVDIFDDNYFEATEGRAIYSELGAPLNNKAKRQRYDLENGQQKHMDHYGKKTNYKTAMMISRINNHQGSSYQKQIGRYDKKNRKSRDIDLAYDRKTQPGNNSIWYQTDEKYAMWH